MDYLTTKRKFNAVEQVNAEHDNWTNREQILKRTTLDSVANHFHRLSLPSPQTPNEAEFGGRTRTLRVEQPSSGFYSANFDPVPSLDTFNTSHFFTGKAAAKGDAVIRNEPTSHSFKSVPATSSVTVTELSNWKFTEHVTSHINPFVSQDSRTDHSRGDGAGITLKHHITSTKYLQQSSPKRKRCPS